MIKIAIATAVITAALAGCASDPAALAAEDKEKCRDYGMRPGTDAFATCRMTLDVERNRERRRRLDDVPGQFERFGPYYRGAW